MFNGIILNTGIVRNITRKKKSTYVEIQTNINIKKKDIGSSICCDGVCLTVEKVFKNKIFFYISNETLKRSNFKDLKLNQIMNLEKSLTFGQSISGHFIQGHVDSVAKIKNIKFIDKSSINDLLNIIYHCNTVISSHTGFVVHAGSAFNKKIIDIINSDIDKELDRWIPFDINYRRVFFNNLSDFKI